MNSVPLSSCVTLWLTHIAILLTLPLTTWAQFQDAADRIGFSGDGKAAFADFNNDGWVDLYAGGRLFRNEGGTQFVAVEESGLPQGEGIWGDFDNDGWPDLFVFNSEGSLNRNRGDGTFQSVAFPKLPTINSRGSVWADLDNDGRIDLYIGGYEVWEQAVHPDAIFLNRGEGIFREQWQSPESARFSARGVTAADFDEDGQIEVFVSNYRLQPNQLWDNLAVEQVDVAAEYGVAGRAGREIAYTGGVRYPICGHSIGSAWSDFDNDGHMDLFVGNFSHPPEEQNRPQFLRNLGPTEGFRFEDLSELANLAWQESFASPAAGDFDNDGDTDLFITTVYATGSGGIENFPVLLRNDGDFRFTDVTEEEGLAKLGPTYQAAWADIDNDGDLDLCSDGKLFVNAGQRGHWLELALVGDGQAINRSAIGAVARIRLGDKVLTRQVEAGTGEGNQNDLRLHFGLGAHAEPVDVEIIWPGGMRQDVAGLALNQRHAIVFGSQ